MRREMRFVGPLATLVAVSLASCSGSLSSVSSAESSFFSSSSTTYVCPFSTAGILPDKLSYPSPTAYTPTTFSKDSYSRSLEWELGEGASLYKVDLTLNNGNRVEAHVVEADPTRCSIEAGTSNGKAELAPYGSAYTQLQAYEKKTGKKVYAISNADYFGLGSPVNAFIKDNLILKNSHNDNGYYDYTIWDSDLPVSMPMLFGIGNHQAKIGPIVADKSVEATIKSKFTYNVYGFTKEGSETIFPNSEVNAFSPLSATSPDFVFSTSRNVNYEAGDIVYGLSLESDADITHGIIVKKTIEPTSGATAATATEKCVVFPHEMGDPGYQIGDYLGYNIVSPDETWRGYKTILGARHEILRNGEIVPTVALETTNGTADDGVPRTAIGIKSDGTVCLFSIEGLRYGGTSSSDDDTYGVSLPQLADLMRYYGLSAAANFDGGSSTELIANNGYDGAGDDKIITRCSDFGTYNLADGRAVLNTIVITSLS